MLKHPFLDVGFPRPSTYSNSPQYSAASMKGGPYFYSADLANVCMCVCMFVPAHRPRRSMYDLETLEYY